jgi:DNA-binding LacI/PurR family transcriptional regulator
MKSIAWLVKGDTDEEPYFGAVIANADGTGETFGWYTLVVAGLTPEERSEYLELFTDQRGCGYLACGSYMNPPIVEVYPNPAPEVLEHIRSLDYGWTGRT